MLIPKDDPTRLSLLFHLNSEPWLNDAAYRDALYDQRFPDLDAEAGIVDLPPPPQTDLDRLMAARASIRAFADRSLAAADLSVLMHACYGVTVRSQLADDGGQFLRRTVPSAGGLYPLSLHVFTRAVEGLKDGLYLYDPLDHRLGLRPGRPGLTGLGEVFYTMPFFAQANAVICLGCDFLRIQKKYGPRGYRYALLEAGHAAQNLALKAVARGLGTLAMGGYRDEALARLIGLDPKETGILYTVACGHPQT